MSVLRQIEKTLDERLRSAFGGGRGNGREAIELYREVLEEVSRRTTPGARGTPVFPFNQIRIGLRAEDAERKAVLKTVFSPGQLANDVAACLSERRAAVPAGLVIDVAFHAEQEQEVELAFEQADAPAPVAAAPVPRIPSELAVLVGAASAARFPLHGVSVQMGRGPQVIDDAGKILRLNDVVFVDDGSEVNATVSRAHAHLLADAASGGWRVYDDGSSFGTSIFRDGRRIDIPAHGVRGVGLRAGDEIWLGNACLRFEAKSDSI
jgi:hypothetical protein